jgi:hypothetical protein
MCQDARPDQCRLIQDAGEKASKPNYSASLGGLITEAKLSYMVVLYASYILVL